MMCNCGHYVGCGCECVRGKCPKCNQTKRFVIK